MSDPVPSWLANAPAWTAAVRERKIRSRVVATDAAVLAAVLEQSPKTVLDLGCGEGWLTRALAAHGLAVTGVDVSPPLIDAARELGGGTFHVLPYSELASIEGAPFDVTVANFSLFDEDLRAALQPLSRTLIIQTLHPAFAEPPYADGWRVETFASMEGEWREPMPWYFRTLASWLRALRESGWVVTGMREPAGDDHRPLSLLLIAARLP
jgi:SAM-dependent methyltransferase